jgi:hypothetical protein
LNIDDAVYREVLNIDDAVYRQVLNAEGTEHTADAVKPEDLWLRADAEDTENADNAVNGNTPCYRSYRVIAVTV